MKALKVSPNSLIFRDCGIGETDSVDVWAQNISGKPQFIRFSLPFDSPFTISPNKGGITPNGLEAKCVVSYKAEKNEKVQGKLIIRCNSGSYEVPITAYPKNASISVSTQEINLEKVAINNVYKRYFSITNYGSIDGVIELNTESEEIELLEKKVSVMSGETIDVPFKFKAQFPGKLNAAINITVEGDSEPAQVVNVTADVIGDAIQVFYEDKVATELHFGKLYVGQKRVLVVTIKNIDNAKRSFVISHSQDEDAISADNDISKIFKSIPLEGVLMPKSETKVSFVFTPPMINFESDIEMVYTHSFNIEVLETHSSNKIQLMGTSCGIFMDMNPLDFNFDRQIVNTTSTKELALKNNSLELPLDIEIKNVAQFRFLPEKVHIPPQQTKIMKVMFYPRNLGNFEKRVDVNINNGLQHKHINISGVCVEKDLEGKKFKRVDVFTLVPDPEYAKKHPASAYGLDEKEYDLKRTKRNIFDKYLTDSAEKRSEKQRKTQLIETLKNKARQVLSREQEYYSQQDLDNFVKKELSESTEDNVNLGITYGEGLKEPDPGLMKGHSLLPVNNPTTFNLVGRKATSEAESNIDIIKYKNRLKPTTPPEINECSRVLSPAQQLNVQQNTHIINFGVVSVYSESTKRLIITNNLQQNIFVELNIPNEELVKSYPLSQVIPPLQSMKFNIVFMTKEDKSFTSQIFYTINRAHKCIVNVVAQSIPIETRLSKTSIEFKPSPNQVEFPIKESVTIHNNSDAYADYEWKGIEQPFSIAQNSGRVPPRGNQTIEITYTPENVPSAEATASLFIVGGHTRTLRLTGNTGKPKIIVKKKTIDFGLIPAGVKQSIVIKMKNTGQDDGLFLIKHPELIGLEVSPKQGRIAAGEIKNIIFSYSANNPEDFAHDASIVIAGCPAIPMKLIGSAQLPLISIEHASMNFGMLFIGATAKRSITIHNEGKIFASLVLDLNEYEAFNIDYSSELDREMNNETCSIIRQYDYENNKVLKTYSINIAHGKSVTFNLVFSPTVVEDYSFILPLSFTKSAPDGFIDNINVSSHSIHPPLLPNTTVVDFGISPLYDPVNPNNRTSLREVVLKNESENPIDFRFDVSKLPKCITVDKEKGRIEYLSTVSVFFSFKPVDVMPVACSLALYASQDSPEALITSLNLSGIGSSRLYRTSTNHVSLPIVPLGMKTSQTIDIINSCFIKATLHVEMPVLSKNFPLRVEFPKGNNLTYTTQSLPLRISFSSEKPISFSTVIAILDDNGHSYSFTVSATTDNSVFTLYPYLYHNRYNISGSSFKPPTVTGEPLVLDYLSAFETLSDYSKIESLESTVTPQMMDFIKRFLNKSVLNTQIIKYPDDLREDSTIFSEIITNLGGKVPKESNTFQKKQVPSYVKKLEEIKAILQYLMSQGALLSSVKPEFMLGKEDYIHYCKKLITKVLFGLDYYGAPEIDSVPKEVSDIFMTSPAFSKSILKALKIIETSYEKLSAEAWTRTILQIIKLFFISKIDAGKFNSTPGVSDTLKILKSRLKEHAFNEINKIYRPGVASNVYSPIELMLLKWVSIFNSKANNAVKTIINFKNLSDVNVIGNLLDLHLPKPYFSMSRDKDALSIVKILEDSKIFISVTENDFEYGDLVSFCIICAQLFMTLPFCLPTGALEFQTPLTTEITQSVNVSNTSNKEITYTVKLDGSQNFSIKDKVIAIMPKQSIDFEVTYFARTHEIEYGRLTLTPEKPKTVFFDDFNSNSQRVGRSSSRKAKTSLQPQSSRKIKTPSLGATKINQTPSSDTLKSSIFNTAQPPPSFASTIVVDLVSNTTISNPANVITVEGELYKPTNMQIEIPNILRKAGKYKIFSRIYDISDNEGNNEIVNQLKEFISDPSLQPEFPEQPNIFAKYLKKHAPFLFNARDVVFEKDNSVVKLNVEFIPISLKKVRCFVLFFNENNGEFIYQFDGKPMLPEPFTADINTMKVECKQKVSNYISCEPCNPLLCEALAYSSEKVNSYHTIVSERKHREVIHMKAREISGVFQQVFEAQEYTMTCSSQFFNIPETYISRKDKVRDHGFQITFAPTKPGDYPCKIVMLSEFDIRVFNVKGIGLANTKNFTIEMTTVAGKDVQQTIPFQNPSKKPWEFRVAFQGSQGFTIPNRFFVEPQSTYNLPIDFTTKVSGTFTTKLTVTNVTKEALMMYDVVANVDDPPATEKLKVSCIARKEYKSSLKLKKFTEGMVKVTSSLNIIKICQALEFGKEDVVEIPFTVFSKTSGIAAGTITFTDPATGYFVWYIIEIDVDHPFAEETIDVETVSRKSVTVNIPIQNPRNEDISFDVDFNETDLFGERKFVVKPKETYSYKLVFAPLTQFNRISVLSFLSEEEGEFIYNLHLNVKAPETNIMAPLQAPIGSFTSTFLTIENPLDHTSMFVIDNDESNAFIVIGKKSFNLKAFEKRQIEIRYLPSSIGKKEVGKITVKSKEVGDWFYQVSGIGKPPQPLSPIIVDGLVENSTSSAVVFKNPFCYPTKFKYSLDSTKEFKILSKRKSFTLKFYGEEIQIPFGFLPPSTGQYFGSFIIESNDIRWTIPIIGNASLAEGNITPVIRGVADKEISQTIVLPLVGEREVFEATDYNIHVSYQQGFDWLHKIFEIKPQNVKTDKGSQQLVMEAKCYPQRPIDTSIEITIQNLLRQKWKFTIKLDIRIGSPIKKIELECVLNNVIHAPIKIPCVFTIRTPYYAYFAGGSANEFGVSASRGYIEPSTDEETELFTEIVFEPRMYGKVMKGLLVIDTLEREFIFDVEGKIPPYVPPVLPPVNAPKVSEMTQNISRWNENASSRRRSGEPKIQHLKPLKKSTSQIKK